MSKEYLEEYLERIFRERIFGHPKKYTQTIVRIFGHPKKYTQTIVGSANNITRAADLSGVNEILR